MPPAAHGGMSLRAWLQRVALHAPRSRQQRRRQAHPRRSARIWRHMAATLAPSSGTTMQRCCSPDGMRMRSPTRTVTGSRTQPWRGWVGGAQREVRVRGEERRSAARGVRRWSGEWCGRAAALAGVWPAGSSPAAARRQCSGSAAAAQQQRSSSQPTCATACSTRGSSSVAPTSTTTGFCRLPAGLLLACCRSRASPPSCPGCSRCCAASGCAPPPAASGESAAAAAVPLRQASSMISSISSGWACSHGRRKALGRFDRHDPRPC